MRLLRSVFVVCLLVLLLNGAAASSRTIAYVGRTLGDVGVYYTKNMYGSPDFSIPYDTKVVVLSYGSGVARLLMSTGDEVFTPLEALEIGDPVTLKQASSKIKYFERMKNEDPLNGDYYDQLCAPWVALVVRELAKTAKEGLPNPDSVYTYEESPPMLKVENSTQYKLRIYMTGPKTITRLVSAHDTWSEQMPQGTYRVLAEAVTGNVNPLRTSWKLQQGYTHTIMLYIKTTLRRVRY